MSTESGHTSAVKPVAALPPVDMETYVPTAITVVRRSAGWPGILLQERRGDSGEVDYPSGIRQHVFYCFLRALVMDVRFGQRVERVRYGAGEGRFTPAGHRVAFRWSGKVRVLMLGFQPLFFERVAAQLHASTALPPDVNYRKLAAAHAACTLTQQLSLELDSQPGAALAAEGIGRTIAILLLREFDHIRLPKPAEAAPPLAVLKVVETMRQRLADTLPLEDLADIAGLSPFYFARQFKAATGHPPHDYLIRLRVDRAQEMIREHHRKWTLAAIASECGFSDESHMARHFKRVLGVSPGKFAAAQS